MINDLTYELNGLGKSIDVLFGETFNPDKDKQQI